MHVLKEQCSLKELCGNTINFGSPTRTEKMFVRLILPICIRLGSGRTGELEQLNVSLLSQTSTLFSQIDALGVYFKLGMVDPALA